MKRLYWRPQKVSLRVLLLIAAVAGGGMVAVESFKIDTRQSLYEEKMAAARLAQRAFEVLKTERIMRGVPVEPEIDPAESGLIGKLLTQTTTNSGLLPAKQSTVNPNFAALAVHLLGRAGVKKGDTVAVGLSGSFPALNTCVLAALRVMDLKPVIISSVGASQFGANIPTFLWPEMERVLAEKQIAPARSIALSRGGVSDQAVGLSKEGLDALDTTIRNAGAVFINEKNVAASLDRRMAMYREKAGGRFSAYINVGGGTVSVGTTIGKHAFRSGLNKKAPRGPLIDSVMSRFARLGVPVIHLSGIAKLTERYALAQIPKKTPQPGEGNIFVRRAYNTLLAAIVLVGVALLLFAFVRLDWGYRLLSVERKESGSAQRPEQMV